MNNVKLNDEQIEELQRLFEEGFRYLFYQSYWGRILAYEHKPNASSNLSLRSTCLYDDSVFNLKEEEPFYFGDLFEVVYKGEV